MHLAYPKLWILALLQSLSTPLHADDFEIAEKPRIETVRLVCKEALNFAPAKYYDLDKPYSADIDMKEHRADITGDGIEEIIISTYVGSGLQPAIRISTPAVPYNDDPRFPDAVNERHDRASDSNRYSVIKADGSLFYASFWNGKLDSVAAKVFRVRKSDSYNFVGTATICTFRPMPKYASEILLYCGLPDAAIKNNGQSSRCAFAR